MKISTSEELINYFYKAYNIEAEKLHIDNMNFVLNNYKNENIINLIIILKFVIINKLNILNDLFLFHLINKSEGTDFKDLIINDILNYKFTSDTLKDKIRLMNLLN